MKLHGTSSQTAGPFVHLGTTDKHAVGCLADEGSRGERINLKCFDWDGDGWSVTGAGEDREDGCCGMVSW